MSNVLEQIGRAIVRPPRREYSDVDLQEACKKVQKNYVRTDVELPNAEAYLLKTSVWSPPEGENQSDVCIIYCHPNSGNRMDTIRSRALSLATALGCSACGFDFAGCGQSDGDFISLGANEKNDIAIVIAYLLGRGYRRFVLWGRSMGAASTTLFLGAYQALISKYIIAVILDSPYTSFRGIVKSVARQKKIPLVFRHPVMYFLRNHLKKKCNFDLHHINPLAAAKVLTEPPGFSSAESSSSSSSNNNNNQQRKDLICSVCAARIEPLPPPFSFPVLVLSADQDIIVPAEMSEDVYKAMNLPKIRVFFRGEHNSPRPLEVFRVIIAILTGTIEASTPENLKKSNHERVNDLQNILDSAAFTLVEFLKSKAPPELVDQVIRTSASYVEDGRKDSLWDLCGGLSIQSSVPIPDADRYAVNRRSASASASSSPTSLFSTIFKMTSKPEIHESFPKSTFDDIKCSKCAASTISPSSKMSRANSGVSDFDPSTESEIKFDPSPIHPVALQALQDALLRI